MLVALPRAQLFPRGGSEKVFLLTPGVPQPLKPHPRGLTALLLLSEAHHELLAATLGPLLGPGAILFPFGAFGGRGLQTLSGRLWGPGAPVLPGGLGSSRACGHPRELRATPDK